MKKVLFLFMLVWVGASAQQQVRSTDSMHVKNFNFTFFPQDPVKNTSDAELNALVPASFHTHPEFGKLPFNVQMDSVFELIDKRTEYTRTLVKSGSNGKDIFVQKGYFPLNFVDQNGLWRTIDDRLHPSDLTQGLYEALSQPAPTKINVNARYASVMNTAAEFKFDKDLKLYHADANGNLTLIGNADWSHYTAGSDGVKVKNVWAGIDMEIIVSEGKVKTNYLINNPLLYNDGWLVIEDNTSLPGGMTASFASSVFDSDGLNYSNIDIKDAVNNTAFTLGSAYGFDQSGNTAATINFGCKYDASNRWQIFIPVSWVSNSNLQFPLVVDPLVTSSATTLQAAITGSFQQNSGLFTNSCDYFMNVPTPANCTVTDVLWSFNYIAQNGAALCYGAITFSYGACNSPSAAGFYWFCNNCVFAGTCTGTNISIFPDVSPCIPAPQCASYNMGFTLHFYARAVPNGPCSNFYIGANSNWVMTIQGHTVEHPLPPVSSNGTTICLGSNTTLTANGQYGVPPYTYLWNPTGATTQSITVAPTTTTTYSCTITDACGNTAVNQVTITVNTNNTLSPLPVMNYSMNPASGNPCPVTITFCSDVGNAYGGGSENYQWNFGGGTQTTGGATSGSANGPDYGGAGSNAACPGAQRFYTVVYNTPGSYYPSVTIIKGGACATTTSTITICGVLPVRMLFFDAAYDQNQAAAQLTWATGSETNCSRFEIERTSDGAAIQSVGFIFSKAIGGNSIERLDYSYSDYSLPGSGTYYYRLKQIDKNGDYVYSEWKSVQVSPGGEQFFVRPSVVSGSSDRLQVGYFSIGANTCTITVLDAAGRSVKEENVAAVDGMNLIDINPTDLVHGIYFVRVVCGDRIYNGRFVRNSD